MLLPWYTYCCPTGSTCQDLSHNQCSDDTPPRKAHLCDCAVLQCVEAYGSRDKCSTNVSMYEEHTKMHECDACASWFVRPFECVEPTNANPEQGPYY